jgi:hypothetical protein
MWFPVAESFIIGERFVVITRQLQAAEVLFKLSTMNDKSSFVKFPLVITKQLKLYLKIFQEYQLKSQEMATLACFASKQNFAKLIC